MNPTVPTPRQLCLTEGRQGRRRRLAWPLVYMSWEDMRGTRTDTPPPPASRRQDSTVGGQRALAQGLDRDTGGTEEVPQKPGHHLLLPGEEVLTRVPVQKAGPSRQVTHWEGALLRCQVLTSPLSSPGGCLPEP